MALDKFFGMPETSLPRLLILEKQELVRQGIRCLLEGAGWEVEECETTEQLDLFLERESWQLLIINLDPPHNGVALLERVKARHADLPVLALSACHTGPALLDAVRVGARGFVSTSARRDELMGAVTALRSGGCYFDARATPTVLSVLRGEKLGHFDMTPREREILKLVCAGLSNQYIADRLHLSLSSIKNHLRSLFVRFGVSDRTGLIMAAEARMSDKV